MENTIRTVFQAGVKPSFFENIAVRPNGALLLTRQDVNELWEVDPVTGTGKSLVTIPEVASLTGISEISHDVFAVGGGIYRLANHEGTVPHSYSVWVVDLTGPEPKVRQGAKTPEIGHLNGTAPWDAETVLVADSHFGKVHRVNLSDGTSTVCLEGEAFGDPPNSPVKLGVNGIKVRQVDGVKYVYFTNTSRMLFCRVPVDESAVATGLVEVLSSGFIPQAIAAGTLAGFMPDDFCIAEDGTAYATTHPTNMVMKIAPSGGEAVKIAGGWASWDVASATACALGRTEADKNVLYVTTAGANVMPINGQTEPAKVLALQVGV
ncbi:hypothetical protein GQ53DRAFT_853660 [Thozetella sp. PMI_491]|nr:hypothetical protein GQ53DRAFT_853660 [Thozetella sp. PMI_491]